MNSKNRKTLQDIFATPVKKSIKWRDVERLIFALEGSLYQRSGSRVRVVVGAVSLNIRTPHPQNELKPYQVRKLRDLLIAGGITL